MKIKMLFVVKVEKNKNHGGRTYWESNVSNEVFAKYVKVKDMITIIKNAKSALEKVILKDPSKVRVRKTNMAGTKMKIQVINNIDQIHNTLLAVSKDFKNDIFYFNMNVAQAYSSYGINRPDIVIALSRFINEEAMDLMGKSVVVAIVPFAERNEIKRMLDLGVNIILPSPFSAEKAKEILTKVKVLTK